MPLMRTEGRWKPCHSVCWPLLRSLSKAEREISLAQAQIQCCSGVRPRALTSESIQGKFKIEK